MNLFSTFNPDVKSQVELMSPLFTLEIDRFSQNSQGRIKLLNFYIDRVEAVNALGLTTLVNTPPSPVLTNPALRPQFSFHLSQQNDASYKLRITPKGFGGGQGQSAPVKPITEIFTYSSPQEKKLFDAVKRGDWENLKKLINKNTVNAIETCEIINSGQTYQLSLLQVALTCRIDTRATIVGILLENGAKAGENEWFMACKHNLEELVSEYSGFKPTQETLNNTWYVGCISEVNACMKQGIYPYSNQIGDFLDKEEVAKSKVIISPPSKYARNGTYIPGDYPKYKNFNDYILKSIDIKVAPLAEVLTRCNSNPDNLERAKELIERGADVSGYIIEYGFRTKDLKLIQLIIEKGAKPLSDPNWFETLLTFPWHDLEKERIAKLLLEKGAPACPNVSIEKTPLYYSIQHSFFSLIPLILEKNTLPLRVDLLVILMETYQPGNKKEEIAEKLIKAKTIVNFDEIELKKWGIQKSPLFLAIESGNENLMKLFFDAGADYHNFPKHIYRKIPLSIQKNLFEKLETNQKFKEKAKSLSSKILMALDDPSFDRVNAVNQIFVLQNLLECLFKSRIEVIFGCPLLLGDQNELRLEQNALVKNLSECLMSLLSKKSYFDKGLNQNGISEALKENLFIWFDTLEKEYKKEVEQQQKFNLLVQQQQTLESQLTQQKHQNLLSKEQLQLQQEQIYLQQEQFLKLQKENEKNQQLIQGAYAAVRDAEDEVEKLKGKLTYGYL